MDGLTKDVNIDKESGDGDGKCKIINKNRRAVLSILPEHFEARSRLATLKGRVEGTWQTSLKGRS
eukprot:NODE_3607_length_350_cov_55.571429_g2937_i0.p1 GENE.NODE_3607_length_350_cov_55.571429_g2937_i0~~NODE_3607_length_350_cov_55.571429_g2937_i0.p1  ORF type:complete len:65 (-),score=8.45 NODE_3607_length_350_cov_55.571429_g2937_i0:47-241(-)